MIKDAIWVIYSMGGLIGLLSRNRDATLPDSVDISFQSAKYADDMWERYKERFCCGLKDNR